MKRLIIATLLLIFTHSSAFTAVSHSDCNNKTTQSECNGTAGCYWADTNKVCKSCGANSKPANDGLSCYCNTNYHVSGGGNNDIQNNDQDCDPNIYDITLDYKDGSGTTETIKEIYGSYFQKANGGTAESVTPPSRTGYTFTGYYYESDLIIGPDGKLPSPDRFSANTTLEAKWDNNKFYITYKVGEEAENCNIRNPQECTYKSSDCTAASPNMCTYAGYLFGGWKCTEGCDDSSTTIDIGTNIATISGGEDMTLTAQWIQCPAGSYCKDILTKKYCPAGSTSKAGSTTQTQCYMTYKAEIKGINGTFSLPGGTIIYYHKILR